MPAQPRTVEQTLQPASAVWKLLADVLEYHRTLLADTQRCETFRRAVANVVNPGDVVLDIGTGTGLLAMFACQAGARHVYAVEAGAIADLAEQLVADNGFADRITLLRGNSRHLILPEKADVIVSETLWNFGLGEGILATLADARNRFLKPHGRLIPRRMALRVAPIQAVERNSELETWNTTIAGLNLSRGHELARSNLHRMVVTPEMQLADAQTICELSLGRYQEWVSGSAEFEVHSPGIVHGLGGWFDAQLTGGIHLSNEPPSPAPSWKHALMPLSSPLTVCRGDRLRVELQCAGDESAWRWSLQQLPQYKQPLDEQPRDQEQRPTAKTEPMFPIDSQSTLGGFPTALERLAAP